MRNQFELAHLGINTPDPEAALELAKLLSLVFSMKPPSLGANGHIAMRTPDLDDAVAELKEKGFAFKMDTAAYTEDGKLKNIYLDDEFGGFAIHIMRG